MNKIILIVFLLLCTIGIDADIVRRAAFDFGSGKSKVQVADIDTDTQKILRTIYSNTKAVRLSEDLARNGTHFSQDIQEQAILAAKELLREAVDHGAMEFKGIATEAYRKANNGQELTQRYRTDIGIPVEVISQEDEGRYGFSALILESQLNPKKSVAWDIGGGSFQITYLDDQEKIQVYQGPFGRASMKNAIIKEVKHANPSLVHTPNPMTSEEIDESLRHLLFNIPPLPQELQEKLKQPDVSLIGISSHPQELKVLKTYGLSDVKHFLSLYLNKTDEEILNHNNPESAVSQLVLVYGVLSVLNKDKVIYVSTQSGSTTALLLTEGGWSEMQEKSVSG